MTGEDILIDGGEEGVAVRGIVMEELSEDGRLV
jgi:hypothetical protein